MKPSFPKVFSPGNKFRSVKNIQDDNSDITINAVILGLANLHSPIFTSPNSNIFLPKILRQELEPKGVYKIYFF